MPIPRWPVALADLSFLSGGPFYAAMFALVMAGISVSCLLARLLPRGVTWTGLLLAVAGMLSTLSLPVDGFAFLLPVVRFGGLIWLVFAAALVPRTRHSSKRVRPDENLQGES